MNALRRIGGGGQSAQDKSAAAAALANEGLDSNGKPLEKHFGLENVSLRFILSVRIVWLTVLLAVWQYMVCIHLSPEPMPDSMLAIIADMQLPTPWYYHSPFTAMPILSSRRYTFASHSGNCSSCLQRATLSVTMGYTGLNRVQDRQSYSCLKRCLQKSPDRQGLQ